MSETRRLEDQEQDTETRWWTRLGRYALIVLPPALIFLVFASALSIFIDPQAVGEAFRRLTWWEWTVLGVVSLVPFPLYGWLNMSVLPGLRLGSGTYAYLASTAMQNTFSGFTGRLIRLGFSARPVGFKGQFGLLRRWGYSAQDAAVAVSFSRGVLILATLFLPLLAVIGLVLAGDADAPSLVLSMGALLAAAVVVAVGAAAFNSDRVALGAARLADAAVDWAGRRSGRSLDLSAAEQIDKLRERGRMVVGARRYEAIVAGTAVRIAEFALFLLAIRFVGLGPNVFSDITLFAVFAIVSVVLLLRLTPGGVGVAELAFIAALTSQTDLEVGAQVTAGVFLYRAGVWLLPILLGAPLVFHVIREGRRVA